MSKGGFNHHMIKLGNGMPRIASQLHFLNTSGSLEYDNVTIMYFLLIDLSIIFTKMFH